MAFTPWTTAQGYLAFLAEIVRLELIEQVAPIQYTLRLLIPPGSRLLELPEARQVVGALDEASLSYRWRNPDPQLDRLQRDLELLVHRSAKEQLTRAEIFQQIYSRSQDLLAGAPAPPAQLRANGYKAPYLTEPWYC